MNSSPLPLALALLGEVGLLLVTVPAILILLLVTARQREALRDQRAQLKLAAQRRKVVLEFLHDLGEAIGTGMDTTQLLEKIVRFSVHTTQASAGAVFLLDRDGKTLRCETVAGPFPPPVRPENFAEEKFAGRPDQLERVTREQHIAVGAGLIGEVARTGRQILIRHAGQDARLPRYRDASLQIHTAMYVPMKFRDRTLGVMVVVNKHADELEKIFTSGDLFLLDSVATHGAISLHNVEIYKQRELQRALEADIRTASEVQKLLFPAHPPVVNNFDIATLNQPAQQVGGDYFDFVPLDDSRVGIIIADVSGKGVSGALLMATCRAILRQQCAQNSSPAAVLGNLYRRLVADLPEDKFITLIYGILDGDARTFKFVRAGHDPALWFHSATGDVEQLSPKGTALGLTRTDQFERNLQERELSLAPGDILVLYTDGITEPVAADGEEFGRDRLARIINEKSAATANQISDTIVARVCEFTGDVPPHDDRTLIVIKAI
jgi:sigma-B regulation protein RsbU (phosphoserine phosphatase)